MYDVSFYVAQQRGATRELIVRHWLLQAPSAAAAVADCRAICRNEHIEINSPPTVKEEEDLPWQTH